MSGRRPRRLQAVLGIGAVVMAGGCDRLLGLERGRPRAKPAEVRFAGGELETLRALPAAPGPAGVAMSVAGHSLQRLRPVCGDGYCVAGGLVSGAVAP